MSEPALKSERNALRASMIGAFALAAWGLAMARVSGSDAVRLDGAFNLISGVLSFTSLWISGLLSVGRTRSHPLGYFAYESLFVVVKGASVLVLVALSVAGSITTLLSGGREPLLGPMLLYVVVAVSVCGVLWGWMARARRVNDSPLLASEAAAWRLNAIITSAIGLAFAGALAIEGTRWSEYTRYLDQVLVIFFGLVFLKDPWQLFRLGLREITLAAPAGEHAEPVRESIRGLVAGLDVELIEIEVMKLGRKTWVTVYVDPLGDTVSMAELLAFKRSCSEAVHAVHPAASVEIILDRLTLDGDPDSGNPGGPERDEVCTPAGPAPRKR